MKYLMLLVVCLQLSCTGVPKDIVPIDNFDKQRFLGTWYELARLDHSFEKGLSHVTAEYSLRNDGGLKVVNTGFNSNKEQWQEAEGRAYFVKDETVGHLKVSFFGPFYGSYIVFKIDKANYQYAFVTSYNKDYLWLLSRTPQLSQELKADFIKAAEQYGFSTGDVIFVNHSQVE